MVMSVRLSEEDVYGNEINSVWLRPENYSTITDTIAMSNIDLGYPEISEATYSVTEGNGIVDLTRFHGRSTVTIDLTLLGPEKVLAHDQLRAMCYPAKRLWLYISRPEWSAPRRMYLRANSMSFICDRKAASMWKVNLSFVNPSGRMQAVETSSAMWGLGTETTSYVTGIVFPVTFPIRFPATTTTENTEILVRGTVPVLPQIKIMGQCLSPRLTFPNIGTSMYFPNLLIDNDHYLIIDVPSKQVLMDGQIDNSRLNYLSLSRNDGFYGWAYLLEGINRVIFTSADRDADCYVQITWHDEYL